VPRSSRGLFVSVGAVIALLSLAACSSDSQASRQQAVAAKGAVVMPFDLTKTSHAFTKTADGGIQTVTANDPTDTVQIDLIRGHLRMERDRFGQGDFSDPTAIHGADMPGVKELAAGAPSISVTYKDAASGGELTFTTTSGALVDALHRWFEAQTMDHGSSGH
jgi:hypothetical protein